MRWDGAGYVACVQKMRNAFTVSSRNLKGGENLEDIGIGRRIILRWILKSAGCENVHCIHLAQDGVQ
jgi:hypothetical protein